MMELSNGDMYASKMEEYQRKVNGSNLLLSPHRSLLKDEYGNLTRTSDAIQTVYPELYVMPLSRVPSVGRFMASAVTIKTLFKGVAIKAGKLAEINTAKKLIQLTKKSFGHTFSVHGEDMTNFLISRAKGSGMPQGQFLDNQEAAKFILDNLGKASNGAVNIPIPNGFPARIIMPDGTYRIPTHIRLVPGGGGVKTAYPLIT